jgi:hypothetical protein
VRRCPAPNGSFLQMRAVGAIQRCGRCGNCEAWIGAAYALPDTRVNSIKAARNETTGDREMKRAVIIATAIGLLTLAACRREAPEYVPMKLGARTPDFVHGSARASAPSAQDPCRPASISQYSSCATAK